MPASPPPPLKRIPPGLWTGLAWCVAAIWPIVEYVVMPPRQVYSTNYPRDGLDQVTAKVLLVAAFALVVAGSAVLRRRTVTAFVLVLAGTVVSTVAWRQDEIPPLQFLGAEVVLAYVAATRPRRQSLVAAAAALSVLGGYLVFRSVTSAHDSGTAAEPFLALTVAIAWLVGHSVHQARAHTEELNARAAAEAVTAERLRIAREMHDTVAHSIGIIALQAGAAVRVVETQPARAREAMLAVEQEGRETLSGLRRMLGALRDADRHDHQNREPDHASAPPRPAAGLADLERLAAATTAAGVRVEVWWQGRRRPLPPDIDLAAFRIVQEAITNVVRHSGADSCRVTVHFRTDDLVLEIADRGTTNANTRTGTGMGTGTGYGLVGMRERASLLRGDFAAGPRTGGGYLVTARLPIPNAATTPATPATPATLDDTSEPKAKAELR